MLSIRQLQNQLRLDQARVANTQAHVAALNAQLSDAEARLRELQHELDGLEGFRHRTLSDGDVFRSQLNQRSKTIRELGQMKNVRSAQLLAKRLSQVYEKTLANGVENNLSTVYEKVRRAIREVEREMAEQNAHIGSLNNQIADGRSRIAIGQRSIAQANAAIWARRSGWGR